VRDLVVDNTLDSFFWADYADLWHNSKSRSPFQAPGILQFFSQKYTNSVIAVRLLREQSTVGAVLLKKEKNVYSFLSDLKTDANFFVFRNDCSDGDIDYFFGGLLDFIKQQHSAVIFNNVASWAGYFPVFEKCAAKSNLFFQAIDYSVCPVLKCDTPEEIRAIINRSRTLRNSVNKIRHNQKAVFEVLTGDEDLENWVKEFCFCHIQRWEKTPTPSSYRNMERQVFLLKCLQAWSADKVLVRFAIKVNQQRIGFHICLIEQNSLIGHSMTYHPDYQKLSPARVLLLTMAEWMMEKKLRILDFGNGNEKYKYNYINQELVLKRVFISKKANYLFIVKSQLIKLVKNNSRIYSFYQKKIKIYLNRNRDAKIKTSYS